jgi:hypothetical protein
MCLQMKVLFQDFHGADKLLSGKLAPQWNELINVLTGLPVYLKPSGQKGKDGSAVFDPVAANDGLKDVLPHSGGARIL